MTETEKTKALLNDLKEHIDNLYRFWQKVDRYVGRTYNFATLGESVDYISLSKIADLLNVKTPVYLGRVLHKYSCHERMINQEPHYNLQDVVICLRNYLRSFIGE